jgi:Raf kinase inhibitor-like YbhB/YbcL family protein
LSRGYRRGVRRNSFAGQFSLLLLLMLLMAAGACGDDDPASEPGTTSTLVATTTTIDASTTTGAATLFEVASDAFGDNEPIPTRFTCDGRNLRPQLSWSGAADADSIAVVVDDPDAPGGSFIHWIAWGFTGNDGTIVPARLGSDVTEAPTSLGQPGWFGPCPPSGVHRYVFHFYAIRGVPEIGGNAAATWSAIRELSIQEATLTGTYERPE